MSVNQKTKGIWIKKEHLLSYTTWLRKPKGDVMEFIPFEHPCKPLYLGSVRFLDLSNLEYSHLSSKYNLHKGLLQNIFYPLGSAKSELLGKGLAKRIEGVVAKDMTKHFPENTPIIIGASSDSHIKYCQRIGLTPFKAITLSDYASFFNGTKK